MDLAVLYTNICWISAEPCYFHTYAVLQDYFRKMQLRNQMYWIRIVSKVQIGILFIFSLLLSFTAFKNKGYKKWKILDMLQNKRPRVMVLCAFANSVFILWAPRYLCSFPLTKWCILSLAYRSLQLCHSCK